MSKVTVAYLRFHWDGVYTFAVVDGKYTARAAFGEHDLLEADTAGELLSLIRRHYPGTSADLCSS